MTGYDSFHPIERFVDGADPVLFVFATDTPAQRQALRDEMVARLSAIAQLSETMTYAGIESPDARSHQGILECVAILSRDVRGLLEASFRTGA
jgi:hypothetical protein